MFGILQKSSQNQFDQKAKTCVEAFPGSVDSSFVQIIIPVGRVGSQLGVEFLHENLKKKISKNLRTKQSEKLPDLGLFKSLSQG